MLDKENEESTIRESNEMDLEIEQLLTNKSDSVPYPDTETSVNDAVHRFLQKQPLRRGGISFESISSTIGFDVAAVRCVNIRVIR
jgi:hypothetical protein